MDKERKLEALDDSALDAVNGGFDVNSANEQVNDEIRMNPFGNEADSGVLSKNRLQSLVKLFWRH